MSKTEMTPQAKAIIRLLRNQDKWNVKLEDKLNLMIDKTNTMINQVKLQTASMNNIISHVNKITETFNKMIDEVNAQNNLLREICSTKEENND